MLWQYLAHSSRGSGVHECVWTVAWSKDAQTAGVGNAAVRMPPGCAGQQPLQPVDWVVIAGACTAGLGSLNLVDDATCYPIRGQVMRMKAPWVKHVYMFDEPYYVIPNVDTVVVGGTAQRGDFNQTVSDGDAKDIHSAVTSFLPSLKAAPIAYQWVCTPCVCMQVPALSPHCSICAGDPAGDAGQRLRLCLMCSLNGMSVSQAGLRPGRMGVRLEREDMVLDGQADGQAVAVIHNYGHGGSGITLHWGCVEDAINLAANALSKPAQQANARSRM